MPGTKYFADLTPLTAFDANKVLAVENDPVGTGGWKAHVSLDTTMAGDSDALLCTQHAIKTYVDGHPLFNNAVPTPVTIGGIPSGTTFTDQTMAQMWNALLYPYQYPAFTSFSISGQTSPIEVGDSISGAHTFIWGTSNPTNIQANSIDIIDVTAGNIPLLTGLANDGSEPYVFPAPIQRITSGLYTWQILGVNTLSGIFARTYSVSWYWLKFWGTSTNTSLNESQIEALLNNQLSASAPATYSFVAGGYKYMAWPTSFTQPTTFKDSATLLDVAMDTPYTINITNTFGILTNYTVYRTLNQLGSSINIIVS